MEGINEFGLYLRELRKKKGLTQTSVAEATGLNEKTLRRIELNNIIPQIETLEELSLVFKEDLVMSFIKYNSQNIRIFETIQEDIEKKIIQDDFEKLNKYIPKLKSLIATIKNPYYILKYQQYILLIEGIVLYRGDKNYPESMKKFEKGIEISKVNFSIDQYSNFSYSPMEFRLLMNIAFCLNRTGGQERYLKILEFIMDEIDHSNEIFPVVASNLGNAYKRSKKYMNAIEMMKKGIRYCQEKSDFSMLPLLYYGKGVSEYYLNHKEYKNSFKKAVILTDLLGYHDLKISMTAKCKNNFKYDISEEIESFFEK